VLRPSRCEQDRRDEARFGVRVKGHAKDGMYKASWAGRRRRLVLDWQGMGVTPGRLCGSGRKRVSTAISRFSEAELQVVLKTLRAGGSTSSRSITP